ncbi:hypothetical protein WHZ77_17600 [Bradyrhizobium sp. A5]|uniref:hypothetical protein n=1 Tax=Bradyrhizobium sp. A5 TaxID=3133696 RepID=UPI003247A8A3
MRLAENVWKDRARLGLLAIRINRNGLAIGLLEGRENHPAFIRRKLPCARRNRSANVGFMCTKYDPQHEAEAAMKRAAASEGADRQRLIQLALAWHQLARDRRDAQPD